jgi:hypothetical protein
MKCDRSLRSRFKHHSGRARWFSKCRGVHSPFEAWPGDLAAPETSVRHLTENPCRPGVPAPRRSRAGGGCCTLSTGVLHIFRILSESTASDNLLSERRLLGALQATTHARPGRAIAQSGGTANMVSGPRGKECQAIPDSKSTRREKPDWENVAELVRVQLL